MIIPNITPLPPSPQRTDPATFAARADASLTAQETVFTPELNAFASAVNVTQAEMTVLSDTATTQAQIATTQAAAAASSALSAGATVWVSGTTYAVGVSRYSPLNGQVYRRMVGGAGTTDPSLDAVNWRVVNGLTSELIDLPFNNLPSMRPSLNLDFANNQAVDPRITFTRASTATRTNARGLIEAVASGVPRLDFDPVTGACKGLLIEEQRANLLTYSEAMDNAAWTKTRATITANATTAPDGTLTAEKLVEDTTASNTHFVEQTASTVSGTSYTLSFYVKAAERTRFNLSIYTNSAVSTSYDLGTLLASNVDGAIAAVGNGWYRCTRTFVSGFTGVCYFDFYLQNAAGNLAYTGDGTSGLFIWGAQLEAGPFPTTYQPSTETFTGRASTATFYGSNGLIQTASSGVARMNYNPANLTVQPKLLLEASSANLLTYSEAFDNAAWSFATNVTVTANDTTAPDGTVTADRLTKSANAFAVRGQGVTGATGAYTGSVYVKNGDLGKITIDLFDGAPTSLVRGVYDFASNSFTVLIGSAAAFSTTVCPNGWLRISATATIAVANPQLRIYPGNATEATAGYVYAWGAQLEASPYATSYIPTVASQVTRVADTSTSAQTTRVADVASMTGANFSSWYRQDEGSLLANFSTPSDYTAGFYSVFSISDGTANNRISASCNASGNVINIETFSSGTASTGFFPAYSVGSSSVALATKSNDANYAKDGIAGTTDTSVVVPAVSQLNMGSGSTGGAQLNGHLRSVSFYPKRLTNAELQALSTQ